MDSVMDTRDHSHPPGVCSFASAVRVKQGWRSLCERTSCLRTKANYLPKLFFPPSSGIWVDLPPVPRASHSTFNPSNRCEERCYEGSFSAPSSAG